MEPAAVRMLPLTLHESMLLLAGLDAYLHGFQAHRQEDGGASHREDEWQELKRVARGLQERLQQLHRA